MVYNLKSIVCKSFSIFFHLWGGGGPNWHRDYKIWCEEKEAEWTTVGHKFKKSFAEVVKKPPILGNSVFRRLSYLKNYHLNYSHDVFASTMDRGSSSTLIPLIHSKASAPLSVQKLSRRVLRWVVKAKDSKQANSQAVLP
jgi:hypothetical protein